MRWLGLGLVALFLSGCASVNGSDTPILQRKIWDAGGNEIALVTVTLDAHHGGRGCQMLEISKDGDVSYWQQQDASSDWGVVRGLVAVLPETVAAAVMFASGPWEIIRDIIGNRPPMATPSDIHGCEELLEGSDSSGTTPLWKRLLGLG
jgi:hypothetical protein